MQHILKDRLPEGGKEEELNTGWQDKGEKERKWKREAMERGDGKGGEIR